MNTYIALFRGINVGGSNKLPMAELRAVLGNLGLQNIKTYIQSGNVVFQTGKTDISGLSEQISEAIEESFGFAPQVLLLELAEFEQALTANPFPEAESDPKTLHLYFLATVPNNPDFQSLEEIKRDNERFELKGQVFYLHAPDGIGRSKLAARVEKSLGVPATARNWRSVANLMALAKENA